MTSKYYPSIFPSSYHIQVHNQRLFQYSILLLLFEFFFSNIYYLVPGFFFFFLESISSIISLHTMYPTVIIIPRLVVCLFIHDPLLPVLSDPNHWETTFYRVSPWVIAVAVATVGAKGWMDCDEEPREIERMRGRCWREGIATCWQDSILTSLVYLLTLSLSLTFSLL